MMPYIPRNITGNVLSALEIHPVVLLNGMRQAGKSTLAQQLSKQEFPAQMITLDGVLAREAASANPVSFLTAGRPLIIDEVQLEPKLFRALKLVVDRKRCENNQAANGQFLLTGSANIKLLPSLADALVGRMGVETLYPLSACEYFRSAGDFLQRLFARDFSDLGAKIEAADAAAHQTGRAPQNSLTARTGMLNSAISHATFPQICNAQPSQRVRWLDSYLTAHVVRSADVEQHIRKAHHLPKMLRLLAAQVGGLTNDTNIAEGLQLSPITAKHYRLLLHGMFLAFEVPAWRRNLKKRLAKSPKGYLADTTMLCSLLGWELESLPQHRPDLYGHAVENFAAAELLKLLACSGLRARLMHFRTSDHKEVDFVLERPDGTMAAVEVKTAEAVSGADFKNIRLLQKLTGDSLACGVVLYAGAAVMPFGERLFAVPLDALWL